MKENKLNKIHKPSLLWCLSEGGRAISEFSTFYAFKKLYKNKEYQSDGHPVLILPGFMAGETSTIPIRSFLKDLGFYAHDWGLGRNIGKMSHYYALLELVDNLYDLHEQKISIIGWSLGGVMARQLSKERPNKVRQIILMGAPFRGVSEPNYAHWVHYLISRGKHITDVVEKDFLDDVPRPSPVPTTCIFSKEDGIVNWKTCIEEKETSISQNIQVRGSHLGLGVNPSVLHIIADRLKYSNTNWEKFRPTVWMSNMFIYP